MIVIETVNFPNKAHNVVTLKSVKIIGTNYEEHEWDESNYNMNNMNKWKVFRCNVAHTHFSSKKLIYAIRMSITINEHEHRSSKTKLYSIIPLFILSLLTFVLQTEFTSQVYAQGFQEPIILLLVTHGSWWTLWPTQLLAVASTKLLNKLFFNRKYQSLDSSVQLVKPNHFQYFKKAIIKQFHNVYHTSIIIYEFHVNNDYRIDHINELIAQHPKISSSPSIKDCLNSFLITPSIKFILWKSFVLTGLLTIAGFTWYGAMAITYAADVTAIYNCSAFTAYIFAIPLLNEKFSWLKANSVIIAVVGVFIVAYAGTGDDEDSVYPYRFWGNLAISIGAIIYGLYEVFYKRFLCIPAHLSKLITPRRQLVFANFVMSVLGLYTFVIILLGIIFVHVTGIHKFNLFNYKDVGSMWGYIIGSIVANLSFSALFLSLISLTNPVLSSVSALLTIFLIGLVEWILFGNGLSKQQLIGDFLVIIGFVLLTVASWKEISEGNDNDEVEIISNYSFAISANQDL